MGKLFLDIAEVEVRHRAPSPLALPRDRVFVCGCGSDILPAVCSQGPPRSGSVSSPCSSSSPTSWDRTPCAMTSRAGSTGPSPTSRPWKPPRSCSTRRGEPAGVGHRPEGAQAPRAPSRQGRLLTSPRAAAPVTQQGCACSNGVSLGPPPGVQPRREAAEAQCRDFGSAPLTKCLRGDVTGAAFMNLRERGGRKAKTITFCSLKKRSRPPRLLSALVLAGARSESLGSGAACRASGACPQLAAGSLQGQSLAIRSRRALGRACMGPERGLVTATVPCYPGQLFTMLRCRLQIRKQIRGPQQGSRVP